MDCPKCKSFITHVIKSLPMLDGTVKRRRECIECDFRFTTEEHLKIRIIPHESCKPSIPA